jgi:alpha-glucosidase
LSNLKFSYTASPFSFNITRAKTGEVIFNTSAASLVFESQYLRLRTSLPANPNLYGLGEHSDSLRLQTTNYIRTMWNQDSYGIPANSNLYGTHPFYLEHRTTGSHGVLFLNSNGMDIMINKDASGNQYLEYNTIGGVFDFYFVAGPTPVAAVQQYGEFAGFPTMQPYWGLGFHQCRYEIQQDMSPYIRTGTRQLTCACLFTDTDTKMPSMLPKLSKTTAWPTSPLRPCGPTLTT